MARTIQDQGNEDWTVTKKRRRGVEENGNEEMEEGATCRKFGIILGGFRTEVQVLAELHLRFPWIQLTSRVNGAGSAILITKDDRSIQLITDLKTINRKVFFSSPRESNQECLHYDGSTILRDRGTSSSGQGGTSSLPDAKMEYRETTGRTHKYGQDSTGGETTPRQIYQRVREISNDALCEPTRALLQLPEVWPPGQDLQVWTTRIELVQGQRDSHTKVRKLWSVACRQQSPLSK